MIKIKKEYVVGWNVTPEVFMLFTPEPVTWNEAKERVRRKKDGHRIFKLVEVKKHQRRHR